MNTYTNAFLTHVDFIYDATSMSHLTSEDKMDMFHELSQKYLKCIEHVEEHKKDMARSIYIQTASLLKE